MPELITALSYQCGTCDTRYLIHKEDLNRGTGGAGAQCPVCLEVNDYLSEVRLTVDLVRYAEDPEQPSASDLRDMKADEAYDRSREG